MRPLDHRPEDYRLYRLLSSPAPPADSSQPDPAPAQLFAALTAAHAELSACTPEPGLLVVAWHRLPGDHQVQVYAGGLPDLPVGRPSGTTAPGPILFPPGAVGQAVPAADVVAAWQGFGSWVRCLGMADPLWTPPSEQGLDPVRRGGFDDYVAHLAEPFAWLLFAEPLSVDELENQLLVLETAIPGLRRQENSELARVELQRAEARYRGLCRARSGGLWNVSIAAGGPTPASARRTAALLCGASDLDELPYVLLADRDAGSLAEAFREIPARQGDGDVPASPFPASTELLTALTRPPRRELPGIRLAERATFDLTPEVTGTIPLGDVLDDADQPVGTFTLGAGTLNRHTFIAGATGSGKSQTTRHLLEGLWAANIPWLVIEPAKAEYAGMAGRIGAGQVSIIRPGDPSAVPIGLNPLQPEPGFPLQTHIDLVRDLFLAAFEADEPFPQVLSHALTRCYRDLGWNSVLSSSLLDGVVPKYPSLAELQETALQVVAAIGYGKEITDNVRGFIDVRLSSLRLGTPGRFFETDYPIDMGDLLRRNTVLEIEDLGSDQDKAFFIGAILIRLYEHLRVHRAGSDTLRHVTVIEEAHRLLKRVEPGSPAAHAVELFSALLAETRAYGEGMIIAEQIPSKITADVLKNSALKIVHQLPALDDREAVGATMNLDAAQSRHLVTLPPGRAAVFASGMDRPVRVAVPLGRSRENAGTARPLLPMLRDRGQAAAAPLILKQVESARLLADDPELVLWVELLIAAHLVGEPVPWPTSAWLRALTARHEPSLLRAALGYRIRAGIDNRYAGLAVHYQPELLAEHLTLVVDHQLGTGSPACATPEFQWQAGRFRWIDVLRALQDIPTPDDLPHPDTAAWAARGLSLTGRNRTEQLAELRAHPEYWTPAWTVVTGAGTPTLFQSAVDRLSPLADPERRCMDAARFLLMRKAWPLVVFKVSKDDT